MVCIHLATSCSVLIFLSFQPQVAHAKVSRKLQEERATLTRFDAELEELALAIKEKKQAVSDVDLFLKKCEHEALALAKEKTTSGNFVVNLEKQHEWIEDEKECVSHHLF